MERVRLGATGMSVSRFGFGTMTLGDPLDLDGAFEILDKVYDRGINLLDTANTYTGGRSEEMLGAWIQKRGVRDEVILSSKVRYPVGRDRKTAGLNPSVISREIEASLKRLKTHYLDIYYLHQPDDDTPIDVTWRCLESLIDRGLVRAVGLSNFAAWQVAKIHEMVIPRGWSRPLVMQPMYNLIARSLEAEFFPMTREYDLANCVYNPLAGGLLTGKHRGGQAESGSRLDRNQYYRKRYWHPRLIEASEKLEDFAKSKGRSLIELSLRFVLDRPEATTVLLGATKPEQLDGPFAALEANTLSPEENDFCDRVWEELRGPIPRYHRNNADASLH